MDKPKASVETLGLSASIAQGLDEQLESRRGLPALAFHPHAVPAVRATGG
jgi:hypothetical protein